MFVSLGTIGLILQAGIVLSVLILVHELGHFLAAKKSGVFVEEFGIGLPPRMFGKKIGETIYSVNWLPIGGFVKLHGENAEDQVTQADRAFVNKSAGKRVFIAFAGVLMNFILGIVAFGIVYSVAGIPRESGKVSILEVLPGSPADEAGLAEGDVIYSVDGVGVSDGNEFVAETQTKLGEEVVFLVGDKEVNIIPRKDPPPEQGALGIVISSTEIYYPPIWQRPFYGAWHGLKDTVYISGAIVSGFYDLIVGVGTGEAPEGVLGPVGITAVIAHFADIGILPLLNLMGLISINLAILNLVPFPPLDGFRIVMTAIEKFLGKKLLPKVENFVQTAGMALLLALMLFVTVREIPKLIKAGSLNNFVDSVLTLPEE